MASLNLAMKQSICRDINAILQRHKIVLKGNPLKISTNDILEAPVDYLFLDPDVFKRYFTSLSSAKMDKIYAYKNFPFALQMLKNDEMYFTSLPKNEENDSSEYLETVLRTGYTKPFIPDNYNATAKNPSPCHFKNAKGRLPIDDQRDEIFIYCFTNTYNKTRHWNEYASSETGICIEYSIEMPPPDYLTWLAYGRIFYDSGYDFDFLKEIVLMLRRKYQKTITFTGIVKLAAMVKRDRYRWEDESRIVIIRDRCDENTKQFMKKQEKVPGVLTIPNGKFFTWKVKRVIAGNRISQSNLLALEKVCRARNIELQK